MLKLRHHNQGVLNEQAQSSTRRRYPRTTKETASRQEEEIMHRRGINWQARLTALLAMLTLDQAHILFFGHPPNTELGVTIYQGTAALFNGLSVIYFAHGLQAKVSYDLQRLAFCAMFLNAAAWLLYMAQQSPSSVNFLIGMVTYGMLIRTIWISDGDLDSGGWSDLVHRLLNRGGVVHYEKAKQ